MRSGLGGPTQSGEGIVVESGRPHEQMPKVLSSCDVGMIAYGRRLGEGSLPNRLFEYMAAGVAVLAPEYATEISSIVVAEGVGITADFEDPSDVARAILWLLAHPAERHAMGVRARQAFLRRHNWSCDFDNSSGRWTECALENPLGTVLRIERRDETVAVEPMRILVLTNLWPSVRSPNSGTFVVGRVAALSAQGHRVTVCHLDYRTGRPVVPPEDQRCPRFPTIRWRGAGAARLRTVA